MNKKDWPKLAANANSTTGFLLDQQIADAIEQWQLISQHADFSAAKYACYELHIGTRVRQLVMDPTSVSKGDLYHEKAISDNGEFIVGPGETFTLSAAEELNIPADVFALTIPVGNMYRLGLNPETSYADPGFSGEFYVTVCNYSNRNVRLKIGDPLARAFFFHLSDRPQRIHESKPRQVPPSVEPVARPSRQELEAKGDAVLLAEVLESVTPPHFEHAYVTERVVSAYRQQITSEVLAARRQADVAVVIGALTFLVAITYSFVTAMAFAKTAWPDLFGNLLAEIIAAALNFVIVFVLFALAKKYVWPSLRNLIVAQPTK
jgi:deoxycytidine triphosphate deaminase